MKVLEVGLRSRLVGSRSWLVGALALISCGKLETPPPTVAIDPLTSAPPIPFAVLNTTYPANGGLLAGGTLGTDPMILEARRYYDAVKAPDAPRVVGEPTDPPTEPALERETAPMTFADWKQTFGFPVQGADEPLQSFRDRTGVAVYYNKNELGLGRELGCERFTDGVDARGVPQPGVACYVTNYGAGFRQGEAALRAAAAGHTVRNTVCITYRPSLDAGYQVQFYVYGADGTRQDYAQLDTLGPRPAPHVCMNCHGGAYDDQRHLAKNARFLPLDPNLIAFAPESVGAPGLTRAGQEERIRQLNLLAAETPLTPAQRVMLVKLYDGGLTRPGTTATGDVVPPGWDATRADADFYRGVVHPYCATCHLAAQRGLEDVDHLSYARFASASAFDAVPMDAYVCGSFSMPNAQPTSLRFWDPTGGPVVVDGVGHPSAADALLARRGIDRASCASYATVAGCDRGADPDALCGGNVSGGAVCDRPSNRCAPVVAP